MANPSARACALGELMREAGRIAQDCRENLKSELKPDGSIVTNGDRDVETWLRKKLIEFLPGSTVWGEEFGYENEGTDGLWLVDPVDGTSNYSFGSPMWGVSVALYKAGFIEFGSIFLPDLNELYLADRGKGAFKGSEPIPEIEPGQIKDHELVSYSEHLPKAFPQLIPPGKMRCTGSFVVDGSFAAVQRFRGLIGRRERLYDVAAAVLLAQEVNADIRYANGEPFDIPPLAKPVQIEKPWIIFPKDSGFYFERGV